MRPKKMSDKNVQDVVKSRALPLVDLEGRDVATQGDH